MNAVWAYLSGVLVEGLLIGVLFWVITYITVESNSLMNALRASLIAEAVGNLPYLAGAGGTTPPGVLMTLFAFAIFLRLIVRAGELSLSRAAYALSMTYFALVALVACNA